MATQKLSLKSGYVQSAANVGAVAKPDFIYDHEFPLIAEEAWHPNDQSGDTYHNKRSWSFETFVKDIDGSSNKATGKGSDIAQVSKNQFGIGMAAWNQSQDKLYYSGVPFQVSDAGAITKGTVSSQSNSSGSNCNGNMLHTVGFNNATAGSIQGIPANSSNVSWTGRMYWNGNYYMMTWGARFNTSNAVATMDRTTNGDYSTSYPWPHNQRKWAEGQTYNFYDESWEDTIDGHNVNHPDRDGHPSGNWVMTGGASSTPYYYVLGHDTNNYSYYSRWSYNSGSHPSHNTSGQLASHGKKGCGGLPVPQYWDCGWNHTGGYYYFHTTRQLGFGLFNQSGSHNNVATDMSDLFPKAGSPMHCHVIGLRFKSDLCIWLNVKSGEFYTHDASANTLVEAVGSANQMSVLERQKMRDVRPLMPSYNNGSYTEKPIRTPVTVGTVSTLYTSCNWRNGLMIKKWTYNSTGKVLTCDYEYAVPRTNRPSSLQFQRYRFAGVNSNILVNATISDNSLLTVRTYDVSKMFTALGIS